MLVVAADEVEVVAVGDTYPGPQYSIGSLCIVSRARCLSRELINLPSHRPEQSLFTSVFHL
jgi:hypothetical protein